MTSLHEVALPLFWVFAGMALLGLGLVAWGMTHDD